MTFDGFSYSEYRLKFRLLSANFFYTDDNCFFVPTSLFECIRVAVSIKLNLYQLMWQRILNRNIIPIIIIGIMFFVFGFATWINAMLIPYFKIACELSHFQSYLVTFAFYISYLVVSVPSSFLLKKIGFKKGMMLGFWVMAAGAFVFIPAAQTRTYGLFLCGLFLIGIGLSVLQTAANPYVTILGTKRQGSSKNQYYGYLQQDSGNYSTASACRSHPQAWRQCPVSKYSAHGYD